MISVSLKQSLLNGNFGSETPAQVRIRLYVGSNEVSTAGYSAALITNNRTMFPLATVTGNVVTIRNGQVIGFGTPTQAINDVTGYKIFNATDNSLMVDVALSAPIDFVAGRPIEIAEGGLEIAAE